MPDADNTEIVDSQNQVTISLKDAADALRTNTEATTLLANALVQSMDEKTKEKIVDIGTRPGMSKAERRYESRSVMVDHINKLAKSSKDTSILGKIETNVVTITTLLKRLIATVEPLHSGLQMVANKIEAAGNGGKGSSQDKDEDGNIFTNADKWSKRFNKASSKNPFMRTLFPDTMGVGKRLSSYADVMNSLGLGLLKRNPKSALGARLVNGGNSLGRFATGVATGANIAGIAAISGILLAGAAIAAVAVVAGKVIKRFMQSGASAYAMEGRTGREYSWRQQEWYRSTAGMYGLSGEEAFKKQQEYAKYGVRDIADVLSGIQVEKYYGVSNAAQYFQRLIRSTTYTQQKTYDLGKAFANLQVIMKTTNMGMDEIVQHQTAFMDAFKGQTTPFDHNQTASLLNNFKDLLDSYEVSGQELGSVFSTSQRVDTNTLLTQALYASRGGYRFKNNESLLAQAYELRHTGSGDMVSRVKQVQAQLKGLYAQFGATNYKNLNSTGKFVVSEQLLPQMLGLDIGKLPSVDEFISRLERGTGSLGVDEQTYAQIEEAKKTDLDDIVKKMTLLENPLNSIKEFLFQWAQGGRSAAAKYARDESAKNNKDNGPQHIDLNIFQNTEDPLEFDVKVPGSTVKTNVKRK